MKKNTANNKVEEKAPLIYRDDFEIVCGLIATHRNRVVAGINNETMLTVWDVGGFVSSKLKSSAWGDGVVRMLADYIHTRNPKAKGWSYRTLYKMVQLYDTYSSADFNKVVNYYGMQNYLAPAQKDLNESNSQIVPIQLAQIQHDEIVPIESAQIPSVLFATGWCNKN